MKQEGINFEQPIDIIRDSFNQIIPLSYFSNDIEMVKGVIGQNKLLTLEQFTNKTIEELEALKPGICEKYNAIVKELNELNFTKERFSEIINQAKELAK